MNPDKPLEHKQQIQQTTAETQSSGSNFPMEYPTVGQSGGLLSAVVAVVGGVLMLRRRTSRDNLEIAKDRAETNFVKILQTEREEALKSAAEAWRQRTDDAKAISKLTADLEYANRERVAQDKKIQEMEERHERLVKLVIQFAPPEIKDILKDL